MEEDESEKYVLRVCSLVIIYVAFTGTINYNHHYENDNIDNI